MPGAKHEHLYLGMPACHRYSTPTIYYLSYVADLGRNYHVHFNALGRIWHVVCLSTARNASIICSVLIGGAELTLVLVSISRRAFTATMVLQTSPQIHAARSRTIPKCRDDAKERRATSVC